MAEIKVKQWGNSKGIRIPKSILDEIDADTNDESDISVKENSIVLTKIEREELTFEELFKNYDGEKLKTDIQEFEPIRDEKW